MELPRPRKGTEPDRLGSQASKGAWDFLLSGSRCGREELMNSAGPTVMTEAGEGLPGRTKIPLKNAICADTQALHLNMKSPTRRQKKRSRDKCGKEV
jgi:hypothetical protein